MYCARSMKKTNVIYLHARHLPPVYICIVLDVSKQVECLVALCHAYVEVLLGVNFFICLDHFLGLFVLWSNWRSRVHVLGHFSKAIDLKGHMPRFTQQEADI